MAYGERYTQNDVIGELLEIDEEVFYELGADGRKYSVVLVGGSALMAMGATDRPDTGDIDVIHVDREIADIVGRHGCVNGAASAYVDRLPYNYEDRIVELPIETRAVEFLSPSPEDIAVMKLYACRGNDVADLTSEAFAAKVDMDLLEHLVMSPDEAAASRIADPEDDFVLREMRDMFERYRKGELR